MSEVWCNRVSCSASDVVVRTGHVSAQTCMVMWTGVYGHKMSDHLQDESKSYDTH